MSVEFCRESPGKFDSGTLNRKTLYRWTGRIIIIIIIIYSIVIMCLNCRPNNYVQAINMFLLSYFMFNYIHTHGHMSMYTSPLSLSIYLSLSLSIYIYIHIRTYVRMYVHTYMHTHTNTLISFVFGGRMRNVSCVRSSIISRK